MRLALLNVIWEYCWQSKWQRSRCTSFIFAFPFPQLETKEIIRCWLSHSMEGFFVLSHLVQVHVPNIVIDLLGKGKKNKIFYIKPLKLRDFSIVEVTSLKWNRKHLTDITHKEKNWLWQNPLLKCKMKLSEGRKLSCLFQCCIPDARRAPGTK